VQRVYTTAIQATVCVNAVNQKKREFDHKADMERRRELNSKKAKRKKGVWGIIMFVQEVKT
jgi:hypothetical protein